MRIVNRDEFLKLPDGIIYSDYQPHGMIGGLYIKHDTWTNDWIYQDLLDSIECSGSNERYDIIDEAETNGGEIKMDLQCANRDGCFETEQHFMIYDESDVENLVDKLQTIVKQYPSHLKRGE